MKPNRPIFAFLFAFGLFAIILTAPSVEAHYFAWSNACTYAPDGFGGVSFKHACNHHDKCYRDRKGFGSCNNAFWQDMMRECNRFNWYDPRQPLCWRAASQYWVAVSAFGKFRY